MKFGRTLSIVFLIHQQVTFALQDVCRVPCYPTNFDETCLPTMLNNCPPCVKWNVSRMPAKLMCVPLIQRENVHLCPRDYIYCGAQEIVPILSNASNITSNPIPPENPTSTEGSQSTVTLNDSSMNIDEEALYSSSSSNSSSSSSGLNQDSIDGSNVFIKKPELNIPTTTQFVNSSTAKRSNIPMILFTICLVSILAVVMLLLVVWRRCVENRYFHRARRLLQLELPSSLLVDSSEEITYDVKSYMRFSLPELETPPSNEIRALQPQNNSWFSFRSSELPRPSWLR